MDSPFDKNARRHILQCTTAVSPEALDILAHQVLLVPRVNLVLVIVLELKVKRDHQVAPVPGVQKVNLAVMVMALVKALKVKKDYLDTPEHQVQKGLQVREGFQAHQVRLANVYQGYKLVGIQNFAKFSFLPNNKTAKCVTCRTKGTER